MLSSLFFYLCLWVRSSGSTQVAIAVSFSPLDYPLALTRIFLLYLFVSFVAFSRSVSCRYLRLRFCRLLSLLNLVTNHKRRHNQKMMTSYFTSRTTQIARSRLHRVFGFSRSRCTLCPASSCSSGTQNCLILISCLYFTVILLACLSFCLSVHLSICPSVKCLCLLSVSMKQELSVSQSLCLCLYVCI